MSMELPWQCRNFEVKPEVVWLILYRDESGCAGRVRGQGPLWDPIRVCGLLGGVCSVVCRKQLPLVLPVLDRFPLHLLFTSSFSPTFHRCCGCLSHSHWLLHCFLYLKPFLFCCCVSRENYLKTHKMDINLKFISENKHFRCTSLAKSAANRID